MFNTIIFIIGGALVIYKGAEWLVGSAARIAWHLRVSRVIIGLTVIAVGTSFPELVTSLLAGFEGSSDLALGNILGSNMANIGLVLAIAVIIKPFKSHVEDLYRDAPWLIFGSVLLMILAIDGLLSQIDGMILVLFGIIFFAYIISHVKRQRIGEDELPFQEFKIKAKDKFKNYGLIILGLAALVLGARMLLTGATDIAQYFGASELLIGISLVALGTSLPELAVSAWSALHGKAEVTLGNVIGSNIANIFMVLGIVTVITPIAVTGRVLIIDIPAVILFSFLALLLMRTRERLTRWEGILLLVIYLTYITWSFL